jgi:hypothetical protein
MLYSSAATLRNRTVLPSFMVKENRHLDPNSIDLGRSDPADFSRTLVVSPASVRINQGVLRISRG